jgi:exo-beta-1,3-glucanase (GH17 family)
LFPSEEQIHEDMHLLSRFTDRVRTYTSIENPAVPRIAGEHGLRVTAGAWLDKREDNNEREIAALIAEARANPAIDRVMIGNETILRGDLTAKQITAYIKQVKAKLRVPASTAEPWHVWLRYPDLARNVDFITVHLLPYWEGLPVENAVDYVFERLDQLREAYPRKRIVIGEVGWPSRGDRREAANASLDAQAQFIRTFLTRAAERGLDYYFMEAFDQPWKVDHEGRAGGYWGLFNANRTPKFPLDGPVVHDPNWIAKAAASALLAAPLMLWFGMRFRRFSLMGRVFFCGLIQAAMALAVWLACLPFEHYLRPFDWVMLVVLLPSLVAMVAILLVNGFEFTEVLWNRGWLRRFTPLPALKPDEEPFVSIHLPCHNEPPEMVIATLESLAQLRYEHFEVLVIDNNTREPAKWLPVQAWCARAGERFRFFHLDDWPGFKAGALNFALQQTDPRADVIGVVDADYVVDPQWLRVLVPHFHHSPNVAVVQAPQAHRDYAESPFQRMCNWEFDGFFRVGMHHRNERNAIIQHGTMTLVRATGLRMTGGWAEWCICEDAELGLRLMKHAGPSARCKSSGSAGRGWCGRGIWTLVSAITS